MTSKKGCFNEECVVYQDQQPKFRSAYTYCPFCGSKLDYVCNDNTCYNRLSKRLKIYCDGCRARRDEQKEKVKNAVINTQKVAIGVAASAAATVPAVIDAVKKLNRKN